MEDAQVTVGPIYDVGQILQDPHVKWTAKPGVFTDFEFDLVEVFA